MYLRTIQRRNKDGSAVRYVQLAHNERSPESGQAVAQVIHSFGREDQLDRDALARLVRSINRYLGPDAAPEPDAAAGGELAFVASRRLGGCWALDGLWRRLGLDELIRSLLRGRRCDPAQVERVLFALVANRALDPGSKLAATRWAGELAWVPGLGSLDEDSAYRAMDLLLEIEAELAEQVFWATATLLDLEVDLIFFDTTSTYFERDAADPPVIRDGHGRPIPEPTPGHAAGEGRNEEPAGEPVGFRTWGHSKDHRDDLPQVVIGMAVTRRAIPVRVWCWPGNTADVALLAQVRADLRDWKLTRVVWVTDRGFASEENRRTLQRAGGHYIQAEKLRAGSGQAAALARPGRYRTVAGNLRIKEVRPLPGDSVLTDRFVICHNPEQADRDREVRDRLVAHLSELIAGSDALGATQRAELRGQISTKPGLNRYLRVTGSGLLRVDRHAVRREAHLDGKWLLRTSDPSLSAADIAAGYKQLIDVEYQLAGHEDPPRPTPSPPPQGRPHPRPRAAVLASAAAHPNRRRRRRRSHLAAYPRRTRPTPPRRVRRQRRPRLPTHRDHHRPTGNPARPAVRGPLGRWVDPGILKDLPDG
jgi:hypothetical protein